MIKHDFSGWAVGERFALAFGLNVTEYRHGRPIYTVNNQSRILGNTHG